MGAERALFALETAHDLSDGDHGCVAREDRRRRRDGLDAREDLPLQGEILGTRLEQDSRARERLGEMRMPRNPIGARDLQIEVAQVSSDPLAQRRKRLRRRIIDPHAVAGAGEYLRNAVAHETAADDCDDGGRRHD
jgi:hypothetical protein